MKTKLPDLYLVVACCNLDDIPIAIEADAEKAKKLAMRTVRSLPKQNPLLSWDLSGFIGFKVLKFVNGKPTELVYNGLEEKVAKAG